MLSKDRYDQERMDDNEAWQTSKKQFMGPPFYATRRDQFGSSSKGYTTCKRTMKSAERKSGSASVVAMKQQMKKVKTDST